jgi:acyl-CoA synthetase (AMP-forming)/AMP-acid ligase II
LDPDGTSAGVGEVGEVVIRGHNVMIGYVADPEATVDVFRGGWLRTGDLGTKVHDPALVGHAIAVIGRKRHMIKIAGYTVGMEEVERELARIDGIVAAAACGVPDDRYGEALAVLVVRASTVIDEHAISAALRARLGPNHVPRLVRFVDRLPLLANGKLARRRLPELVAATSPNSLDLAETRARLEGQG